MNKKRIFLFLFLNILIVVSGMSARSELKKGKAVVKKNVLGNGLELLIKNNPSNEIVAIEIFSSGGSASESLEEAGLSYLTTRLLFKGTKNKDFIRIARGFDSLGAAFGFSVERDFSEINLVVPRKYWKEAFGLLSEVLTSPSFPEEEIAKEKALMLQEIKSVDDDPFDYTYRLFNENMYGCHPYAKPAYGLPETISKFNRNDIVSRYNKYFCGRNTVLALVGNVNPKEAMEIINKGLGSLPAGERLRLQFQDFQIPAEGKIVKKTDLTQTMVLLGFKAPSINHPDYAGLKLVNSLMGGGMSSRIFENIRDKKGIGYALGTFYPTRLDESVFVFFVGVQPERTEEAVTSFWGEIEKIKKETVSEEELTKTRNYLIGNFLLNKQRNKDQAYFLSWFETLGLGMDFDAVYLDAVGKLKSKEIKEIANKYFQPENSYLFILQPEN